MIKSDVDVWNLMDSGDMQIERTSGGDLDLHVGPGSIDLHLSNEILVPEVVSSDVLRIDDESTYPTFRDKGDMILPPWSFALATTDEVLGLPVNLSAFLWGRSSIGRLGMFVHNAGFTDPGYQGELTLELLNVGPVPIELQEGMRVCQITLHEYETPPSESYAVEGKYQGQKGATPSKLYEDFQ